MRTNKTKTNKEQDTRKNIILELKDKNKNKENKTKNFTYLYFIVVFIVLGLLNGYFFVKGEIKTIQYSEFKELVAKGKIADVSIDKETIQGEVTLEDGKKTKFLTVKVEDTDLIKDLQKNSIKYAGRSENKIISTIISWVLPLALMFLIWNLLMRKMGGAPSSILSFGKSRGKIYGEDEIKITFEDAAGVDEAKEELKEIIEYLQFPQKFLDIGGKIPKGILLVGPPGTGKTLLAKAVAGEAKVPFFSMSGSDFVEMFVGVGASRVRDLFSQAQEKAPCIIFIDELDALGKARGMNPMSSNDEREQTLNQLLAEMDGFGTKTGVIIMGATNRPEILDPALLRPGRFDRHVLVDRPDIKGREEILMVHIRDVKIAEEVDLKVIAARTPGFVGADLANLVNESALLAARKGKRTVSMEEFEEAVERVTAGLEKKKRVMSKKEKEIVAYHETGHALMAEFLETADPVHKISIIPRGIAALGYTLQLPTEDRYLMTKNELLDRLSVLLGGRIAEEIIFGEVSTGAQNDLGRATDIAKSMVKEYGMSEKLGLMTFERERKPLFLDFDPSRGTRDYSEETAREIDDEIRKIMDQSYIKVKTVLIEKREVLERVAQILLEKESIDGETLRTILQEYTGEHGDNKLRKKTD
jgi:cell division protease FtsH